jgi:hypothetical protein
MQYGLANGSSQLIRLSSHPASFRGSRVRWFVRLSRRVIVEFSADRLLLPAETRRVLLHQLTL